MCPRARWRLTVLGCSRSFSRSSSFTKTSTSSSRCQRGPHLWHSLDHRPGTAAKLLAYLFPAVDPATKGLVWWYKLNDRQCQVSQLYLTYAIVIVSRNSHRKEMSVRTLESYGGATCKESEADHSSNRNP
jgi:hypothetical protein